MAIHPSAIVDKGAELGAHVEVGPFAFIAAETRIGDGCVIGPHVVIHPYTSLGANCRVHAGAVLGDLPQDLAFKHVVSRVEIGRDCVMREHVTIHRGTKENSATVVGDGCLLMANSHLGHNVRLGNKVILANGVLLAGYVDVGDGAFFSGNVLVHQFTRVGRLAMLSGGAALSKDVPPFCIIAMVASNAIAGLNVVGMRRAGMTPEQRAEVKRAFMLLFRSGLNVSQAVERIRKEIAAGPAQEICDFIESSKRGICGFGGDEEDSEA